MTAWRAGHVLGAAMFMVEIAGLRVLYTGDYSRLADRHMSAADLPDQQPDIGARSRGPPVNLGLFCHASVRSGCRCLV